MATANTKPEHTVFCPSNCSVRHNEMILALCACHEDNRKPADLSSLKHALYSHLQNGWNAQSSVPDALPDFRFPLVQWACVLGKTQALSWLLTKMKFKAFVAAERTGETSLHRALRLLHQVMSRDVTSRSVDFICSRFGHIVMTLTEQDPQGLFLKDKVQGNSCFHICALCISQQQSVGNELAYYETCMKLLIERTIFLQNTDKLPTSALQTALNYKNDRGETILHILARNNSCRKTARYLLSDYREFINKLVKNKEGETPLQVARDRKADLMVKELDGSLVLEHLARTRPDVFQLYTQDQDATYDQFSVNTQTATTASNSVVTVQSEQSETGGDGGHFLRLNSFLRRDGFYRSESLSQPLGSSEEESFSQNGSLGSPSVLDTPSFASSENVTPSNVISGTELIDISDSEDSPQQNPSMNEHTQTVCVPVDFTNSVTVALPDDETDDEGCNNAAEITRGTAGAGSKNPPEVVAGAGSNISPEVVADTASNNSLEVISRYALCSENAESPNPDSLMVESRNSPAAVLHNGEVRVVGTCVKSEDLESSEKDEKDEEACCNEMSSTLAKIIRQESDVASMLVARLQDKKELSRVELRRFQKDFKEKSDKEGDSIRELQQLKAELDTAHAQTENLERRRQELLDELKSTDKIIGELREKSVELQARVDEKTLAAESFRSDREKAREEYNCLKRKFAEYSEALSEICSPSDGSKAKKERPDDE